MSGPQEVEETVLVGGDYSPPLGEGNEPVGSQYVVGVIRTMCWNLPLMNYAFRLCECELGSFYEVGEVRLEERQCP